ncbi:MAG: T9SS type A sorting domain-containing protein [Flavobacteriales bacterium]|jgi:hypothetical protein|nr:T9SS type A sorting domain-containing protein [Flavobacteriales bacterium]
MKHRNRGDGKRGTSVDARASVGIKPNPASVWVVFEYRLVGELEQAYIRVASIDGREVARLRVNDAVGQPVYDTRQVGKGVYTVELVNGGRTVESGKLIVE